MHTLPKWPVTQQKLTQVTLANLPLTTSQSTSTELPTTKMSKSVSVSKRVHSSISFQSSTASPVKEEASNDERINLNGNERNTTVSPSTSRPLGLRPLVRRPGARRRIRPVNRESNFNPRSRGGPENLKTDIVSSSTIARNTITTVPTVEASDLRTSVLEEEAKLKSEEKVASGAKNVT